MNASSCRTMIEGNALRDHEVGELVDPIDDEEERQQREAERER